VLTNLELAILQAVDRLTPDGYGETDGEAIEDQLHRAGHGVPSGLEFARMFIKLRDERAFSRPTSREAAVRCKSN
jgi:hypothetical protein